MLREGVDHIDAVLYTHTHADHIHGIDDLRPFNHHNGTPLPLYAGVGAVQAMRQNFRYDIVYFFVYIIFQLLLFLVPVILLPLTVVLLSSY